MRSRVSGVECTILQNHIISVRFIHFRSLTVILDFFETRTAAGS